ncbi:MAG: response regulator transcription factor [Actinomycetota bacterium]|nr:response regulator [Actinomycetota bacterium]
MIENDSDLGAIARAALEVAGHDVEVARTVDEAKSHCAAAPPDLALVDLFLTGESGWDFVRWARSEPGHIRLATYSVHADEPEHAAIGKELRVDAMLVKTGDPVELVRVVRALLTSSAKSA